MDGDQLFLEMTGISKSFSGVRALKDVSLRVEKGEIRAIVGENGAGKSTLMKILGGAYQPDAGTIRLAGEDVRFSKPTAALEKGVAVIYQDLNILPHLNVTENVWLGRYIRQMSLFVDWPQMHRKTEELLAQLNANFGPRDNVDYLSTADRQLVIVARGLSYSPKVLVFDEPTSSLTPKEAESLYAIIKKLSAAGVSIIFISHHLSEVIELCDTITVLRDGELVGTYQKAEVSAHKLAEAMVGRELENDLYPERSTSIGDVLLEVKGISYKDRVKNVSFMLRRGEVLGIAGLVGAGRSELAHCIYGALKPTQGSVLKEGQQLSIRSPRDAISARIALVPEDRHEQGLLLNKPLRFNITLPILKEVTHLTRINSSKERAVTRKAIGDLSIKTTGPDQDVQDLSGGNQQKVLIGKILATKPDILILDEPTRGVDIGARAEIHRLVRELAESGLGVILISSDLPEIIGMSDRVLVMHEGEADTVLEADEINPTAIMLAATGGGAYTGEQVHV